ncbi:hypothetical protein K2173_025569 [Erythroxylum novogranatense]|uniref:RSE1/DDB1/CPSF1 second beta-propeller domain-containing protein n=1 Tax=Erythroxylum novogranatense TaxID=1862640 RepID=A0AAV8TB61_9ROSI|nr:hypothetical protein K2173_025569 [Erythroxylum novogranatense]
MAVSPLPGVPSAVWTVKKNVNDEFDAYILVSFNNATLVLSIGETVEEVSDSGFLDTTPSLAVSLIGNDSTMQVHPNGIRHIREDGCINEWRTPGKRTIVKASFLTLDLDSWENINAFLHYCSGLTCNAVQGIVAVAGDPLKILSFERLGETFNETAIPLRPTRKFVLQTKRKVLVTTESDRGAYAAEEHEAAKKEMLRGCWDG